MHGLENSGEGKRSFERLFDSVDRNCVKPAVVFDKSPNLNSSDLFGLNYAIHSQAAFPFCQLCMHRINALHIRRVRSRNNNHNATIGIDRVSRDNDDRPGSRLFASFSRI